MAPAGPLLERLRRDGFLVLETVERALAEQREAGEDREAETLYEIAQSMDAIHGSLVLALSSGNGDLYGLLSIRDERMRDAFAPEEVQLLAGLAAQASIALENSRAYQRLKERDRLAALGEMAAGLAHEIRNPLGAIKASAQLLVENATEGDTEFLEIIVEETDRLNRVVGSFLDYARPARGNPLPCDVTSAVDRTLQLLKPECQTHGTLLIVEQEPALPMVRIDVEQLRQVLLNLVQNALQALDRGGEIHVATASVERGRGEAPWVEIRVRDTGPGIPPEVLANLFVPFVTTKDRGTGLGLAISQRIVAAAGGRILVRTRESEGTTFVVRLPASEERTSAERVSLSST
jgi:signal transduction histidine kinase